MKDMKSNERSLFSFHGLQGVKKLCPFKLNFSNLNESKFRHNFK